MREKTRAHRRLHDDVPEDVKKRRTDELLVAFRQRAEVLHQNLLGSIQTVLVTGPAKRQPQSHSQGRSDGGTKVIFPNILPNGDSMVSGQYVLVHINQCNSQTLHGQPLCLTSLSDQESHQRTNMCLEQ